MGLSFATSGLLSRANHRIKRLASSPMGQSLIDGVQQNAVSIANYTKGFAIGTALSAIPHLVWSLTALWDLFVQGVLSVYYFDWNMPDETLDQQARAQWQSYAGLLGGTVGNTLGWLACGVLPATSIMAVNESMGAYVLKEVGQEAFEEFTFNVSYVLRYTLTTLARQGFYSTYKNVRRWLKDPGNPVLEQIFGSSRANQIRNTWGEADSESFTFANEVEERIEQIPSQFWQNFTEELIESAFEGCIEAGYVVANSLDGYLAQQKIANTGINGPLRVVEMQPDRTNDREKIIIAGPEQQAKATITQTLAHYQMVSNRDIGQIIGTPVDDYIRELDLSLRIKFKLYSVPSPPYSRTGASRLVEAQITVPDIKRSALEWGRLRMALGGANGYLWGPFKAVGRISNKRYVTVFGGTEQEAYDRLIAMMTLSDAELLTVNVTRELRELERVTNPRLHKSPTRIYPAYMTIINRDRIIAIDTGRLAVEGNFNDKEDRFELWRATPPPDFEQRVAELLRRSGDLAPP